VNLPAKRHPGKIFGRSVEPDGARLRVGAMEMTTPVLAGLVPHEVNGLPAHVLLVHVTVVALPVAALCTVLSACWPTARRRLGVVTPLLALVGLVMVPVTVSAGEWLYDRVGHTPQLEHHEKLGEGLLPWAIALFVVAAAEYAWFRWGPGGSARTPDGDGDGARPASRVGAGTSTGSALASVAPVVVATVLALAVGAGAVVEVYKVGDSGAKAVWQGSFSETSRSGSGIPSP
jgi:hypothetical protein